MILYICYSLCLYIYSANIIYCKYATHARLLFINRAGRKTCQDAPLQAYLLGWEIACRSTSLLSLFTLLFSTFLLIFVFFSSLVISARARACDVFDSAKRFDIDVETSVGCRKKKKEKLIIAFSFRLWLMTRIVFFKYLLRHEYSCSRIYPAGNWLGNADGRNFYETREI